MTREVTLLLADPAAIAALPESLQNRLSMVMSRAARRRVPAIGATRRLLSLHGLPTDAEPPVAAIRRQHDAGDAAQGDWLCADPVHMEVGAHLLIRRHSDLELLPEERERLGASLADYFRETGLEFSAPTAERWYLRGDEPFGLTTTPPDELLERDAADGLPEGRQADRWRRIMNETQILLHNHPVNDARRHDGRVTVNSLWFWGAGRLPRRLAGRFGTVIGGEPLARALHALSGTAGGDHALIVLGSSGDVSPGPMAEALAAASRLRVLAPARGLEMHWRPWHGARLWRRARPWWHWFAAGPG